MEAAPEQLRLHATKTPEALNASTEGPELHAEKYIGWSTDDPGRRFKPTELTESSMCLELFPKAGQSPVELDQAGFRRCSGQGGKALHEANIDP